MTADGSVRRQPQQGRSATRVAEILAAARRLLQTGEVGDVTVRTIAAEAGVGPASVYRYFADVDEIVDVLVTEHAAASAVAAQTALASTNARTVGGVFEAVLRAFLQLYTDRPELAVVWRSPALADRQRRNDETADHAIAGEIGRHLVRIGAIDELTTELHERLTVQFAVAGTLLGAVLRAGPSTRPTLEADLFALVRHLGSRY